MNMIRRCAALLISISLVIVTVAVFYRVVGFDFTNYDDDVYVTNNPAVKAGLNRLTLVWAFNTMYNSNWHPLTWISYLTDSRLFGLNAGAFHAVNLLFHLANVVLLFLVLRRLTSRPGSTQANSLWRSAFVAALFAVHPLHVESVAWIAERKDVLSTLFWILTMWAYAWYAARPNIGRQALVLAVFALGLMAKPMLVTLPLALLLLDYWPLRRFKSEKAFDLVWEKLPLLGLALISSLLTYRAQQAWGSMVSANRLSVVLRIENAFVSYVGYIGKMIVPRNLAVFYPFPKDGLPLWEVIFSAALLVGITLVVIKAARRRPYLAVGWLWYVVTLVPVIGLVQVGSQAMADRYTYVPLIGLFLMISWLIPESNVEHRTSNAELRTGKTQHLTPNTFIIVTASLIIAVLMVCSWMQVGHWKDSVSLFERAVAVTQENFIMYTDLGVAYDRNEQIDQAIWAYNEAIRIRPSTIEAHNNLAVLYYEMGEYAKAWDEVAQCRKYGYEPAKQLIEDLSSAMPELR